jgi:hypothetical protein
LRFYENEIVIRGRAIKLTIPITTIRKIYCNDARTADGISKERLTIMIEQKRRKATAVRLKNYNEAGDFMQCFMNYENIDVNFYDFYLLPSHMEEE